ncbi:ammonium transporter [Mesorhizobium australicum]|uniref:Ammonium transporter, Amt family n=1 Tax=Mesorhizobium australicum TaxID=536018 RepID=A0A1X7PF54_9HYPH|nr:ammonium transporter [Mesorhizobium australicum]SMH49386.1 ammonium transporter, Amt family [Mesorhizobium australicum]
MTRILRQRGVWILIAAGLAAGSAPPQAAAAELSVETLKRDLDMSWTLLAAGLVLMMQVGFLLLEAGMVRSKNSINVAQKNLLDMVFAIVAFGAVGFMLAFAPSRGLLFGFDTDYLMVSNLDSWQMAFFVFQVMFCGTAATIVSGAVAERMRLFAYVLGSIFIALVIYPVFVHWAWGAALQPNESAFLGNMGFIDFAGSTVVHSTGAWVSLAACWIMGAREGRYDVNGDPVRIAGHNPVLTTAGAIILFVGWIGFNGGSTVGANPDIAHIIANTVIAAGTGGVAGYLLGWHQDGVVYPEKAVCGMLGGLVAITAGCMALGPIGAFLVGIVGGLVAIWGNDVVERDLKIDDAVGAIGVHGFSGVAGTLAVALLAPVENLPAGSRFAQLEVQATGVVVNFIWSFGVAVAFFWALSRITRLRVTSEEEQIGLNEAEHGTRMGIGHVEQALEKLVHGKADLTMRIPSVQGDESETLTRLFNGLMDSIQREEHARAETRRIARDAIEAERLSALANATFEAIVILQDGRIVDGNDKLAELFGTSLAQLKGRQLLDLIAPDRVEEVREAMTLSVVDPYECAIVDMAGTRIPVEMRGREVTYHGAKSRVGCIVDLRERKNAEDRIRHLALHDTLTGLPNRALFNEKLAAVTRSGRTDRGKTALLLIDLDRFKNINDIHGHPAGDRVIEISAQRLAELSPDGCLAARLGGDEFAILFPGLAFAAQAADLAFRIVSSLILPITLDDGTQVRVGASVGVSVADSPNELERLVSRADTALYHAKHMGRNTYCLYEPGMDAQLEKRRAIEGDLAEALERGQFDLHFQPRVSIATRRIVSYEALVRWHHPEKGMISPADFIPIAEQNGKIIAIGEWILREACRRARSELGGARVSVNVSPVQFRQRNFVEAVGAAIADTGIDPTMLELEITEGVLIDDDRRAHRLLSELKRLGVTIALDDFGTGYSSLGYLGRFPVDTIKIDRSFIRDMAKSDTAMTIVRTIAGLGNGLGMTIVAEGVETMDEARLLANIGCSEFQGYLLGRPVPVSAIPDIDHAAIAQTVEQCLAMPLEEAA